MGEILEVIRLQEFKMQNWQGWFPCQPTALNHGSAPYATN